MQLAANSPTCQQASSATSASSTVGVGDNWDNSVQYSSPTEQGPTVVSWCLDVPHVRQEFNWDCGLACVLMVLKALSMHWFTLSYLRRRCSTKSIWTIDLAHLIQGCGVPVELSTTTIGANPSYAKECFYAENLIEDEARVAHLFRTAPDVGIVIKHCSIGLREIQQYILSRQHLIIALVDKGKLNAAASSLVHISPFINSSLTVAPTAYTGHYIIICGYNSLRDEFDIRDPASEQAEIQLPSAALELARKSFGTDEDLLIVHLPHQED